MRLITILFLSLFLFPSVFASELNFKFHSPSFSGNGKSSHYLTIENIEKTRKDAISHLSSASTQVKRVSAVAYLSIS